MKEKKLLEVKEKFLNKKAELEKEVQQRNSRIQQSENKLKQREISLNQRQEELGRRKQEVEQNNQRVENEKKLLALKQQELEKMQRQEQEKLEANIGGIRTMAHIPDAILVVDPKKEKICVNEAHSLGITLIGIADTNCDPDELDYIIPGNDDAIRAVKLLCSKMADAVIEARQGEENVAADAEGQDALAAESAASEAEQAAEGTL